MKNYLKSKKSYFLSFTLLFLFVFYLICFQKINLFKGQNYSKIFLHNTKAYADSENGSKQTYLIYDLDGALISETNFVEIGDIIIDKNLNEYEIIYVDNYLQIAQCKYTGTYNKPKIKNLKPELYLSNNSIKKSIGLYMTHNDESYVPSDGYSSIYGKGGIHDVATQLSNNFKDLGYTVYLNENLHLPHDSDAYSRSLSTAKDLLNKNPDALFDIHRDGVARNVYVKTVDGVERCKVRIVVGQKNPNKDANLQFAMYLVTVAEEYCPWLFLDIYYAKGNYNQELTSKGLLFEMGTYLAEKELVLNTTKNLAEVVDKTLFSTVIEEDNSLTITDKIENEKNLINNVLNNKNTIIHHNKHITNVVVFTFVGVVLLCFVAFFAHRRKIKHEKQNKIKKEK